MIGTSTRACLLTETGGSTERVLVSVPAGFEGLHATVIDAKRPAPTEVTFQEAFPPDVRSGERWSSILVSDRGVQRYRILVSHDGPLPLEVVSIIDALAAQQVEG